jgi:hypothetical protein
MVPTTRSQIRNDKNDRTLAAATASVNNPITTQNIIMVQTKAKRLAAIATVATAAAAAAAAVSPVVQVHIGPTYVLGSKLCDADVEAFFKDKDNMNCSNNDAVAGLAGEGIAISEDLVDFEDDDINNMARNLSKATPNPVQLSAICVKRLKVASESSRYYKSVGRDLSASNMSYSVMSTFWKQWQALTYQKKSKDKSVFPKMDQNTSILKWTEAATNSFDSIIGSWNLPLSYVIRPDSQCLHPLPPLSAGKPWGDVYGSIQNEMEMCLDHDHPVFDDDNHAIFDMLCKR